MPSLYEDERPVTTVAQNLEMNNLKEPLFISRTSLNFPNSVFIEWTVNDQRILEDKRPLYEFDVYRSQSDGGDWTKLTTTPITDSFYLDETINLFAILREYTYKIVATSTNLNTEEVLTSPVHSPISDVPTLNRRRFLEYQKIKYNRRVQLFLVNAEVYVLKRKHFGERCTTCFDAITNTVLQDKCPECYGTSFTGGFHSPVRVLVEYSKEDESRTTTMHGYSETNQCSITMQDAPSLTKDDILVDLNFKRVWKVLGVNATLLNKVSLSQTLQCTELARDSIEYQIPINPDNVLDLYKTIRQY